MRPVGKLLLRHLDCHKQPRTAQAAWKSPRCGSPDSGNSFTLTAVCNAFGGFWRIHAPRMSQQCIESSFARRNLRINRAICRHREKQSRDGRHPQPVHKARLIIRRTSRHSKREMEWTLSNDGPAMTFQNDESRSSKERLSHNGRQRPPKFSS